MAGTADRTLLLKLIADVNGLDKAKKGLGSFTKGVAKWGKAFSGSLIISGIEAIGQGFAHAFDGLREKDRLLKQTEAVLKSTGHAAGISAKGVNHLSEQLEDLTSIQAETTRAAENMLLTFTNIKGGVFKEATRTVLDMSVALGQDARNSAIQLGKALNDPIKGITALQRVGVTFTDQQKQLIARFMRTGQVAKAQGVILKELQKEFGGSAKNFGNTLEGRLHKIQNAFGDIFEGIVKGDPKAIGAAIGKFANLIQTALFGKFDKFHGKKIPGLVDKFGAWGKRMGDSIADGLKKTDWGKTIGDTLNTDLEALSTAGENGTLSTLGAIGLALAGAIFAADVFLTAVNALFALPMWAAKGAVSIAAATAMEASRGAIAVALWTGSAAAGLFKGAAKTAFEMVGNSDLVQKAARLLGSGMGGIFVTAFAGALAGEAAYNIIADKLGELFIKFGMSPDDVAKIKKFNEPWPFQILHSLGFAGGTGNAPSGWHWVGEKGPELMRFRGGEQVLPHRQSMAMAGGGGNVYNVTVNGFVGSEAMMGQAVIRAIQAAEKRSGNVWRRVTG